MNEQAPSKEKIIAEIISVMESARDDGERNCQDLVKIHVGHICSTIEVLKQLQSTPEPRTYADTAGTYSSHEPPAAHRLTCASKINSALSCDCGAYQSPASEPLAGPEVYRLLNAALYYVPRERKIHREIVAYLNRPAPPPADRIFPIARLTIAEDDSVTATMYTPGLPPGEHDVYPAAPSQPPVPEPQPIATAPRDGSSFIGVMGQWLTMVCWNKHRNAWCSVCNHYCPLPEGEVLTGWLPRPVLTKESAR